MNQQELKGLIDGSVVERFRKVGAATVPCRSCNEEMIFLKTKNGKFIPVNLDLTPHHSTCPSANDWRRKVKAHQ